MNVLVAGGTGFIGSVLCRELHDRGHDVVAMSRNPDASAVPTGVSVVDGDVTEPATLEEPVAGMDAVVNFVSPSPLFQTPKGISHRSVHRDGTANLVAAATAAGVDRFVQISGLGADPDGPTAYIRAKGEAEAIVKDSSLEWVIVRPSVVFGDGEEFTPFVAKTTLPIVSALPAGGRTRFQPIWVEDFAPMLADCVEDDRYVGGTYEIGGKDRLTLADVTRMYYESRGQRVSVLPVPMALSKLGLTLAGPIPFVPFGREQARSLTFDNTTDDNDVEAFGVDPAQLRSYESYLNERAAPVASTP